MNSRQKGFFFEGFPWIVLAVLLFLSVFGARLFFHNRNNPEHLTREFQQKILMMEEKTRSRVEQLALKFNARGIFNDPRKIDVSAGKNENGEIFLFVFNNDSLIYWNSNEVILPDHFPGMYHGKNFASHLKNGWYGFTGIKKGPYLVLGSYRVKSEFPFQNEFIQNRFSSWLGFPDQVSVNKKAGQHEIFSADNTWLFSLSFDNYLANRESQSGVIFLLFILGSLSLFYFLFRVYAGLHCFRERENLLVICFAVTIVVLRVVQGYFRFPAEIYQSELFGPAWYSSSAFLPSLGDFTLNAIMLLLISLLFYRKSPSVNRAAITSIPPFISNFIILLILVLFFQAVGYFIADLVINSSIALNLQNISALTYESGFGLFIIAVLLISLWLITTKAFEKIIFAERQAVWYPVCAMLAAGLYTFVCRMANWNSNHAVTLFFLVYTGLFWYLVTRNKRLFSIQAMLYLLIFYAVFATFLLNTAHREKEAEEMNLLAIKLASRRNPVTEVLYEQVERRLQGDTVVEQWTTQGSDKHLFSEDSLADYLETHYFKDYWKRYQVQVTFCDPKKNLRIQPQGYLVNCNTYFRGIVASYGEATTLPNLFFLDYGLEKEFYLACISHKPFGFDSAAQPAIFIEFSLKNAYPDPGYPGLLMDKSRMEVPSLSDYSYGLYQNGTLVRSVGAHGYKVSIAQYKGLLTGVPFFTEDHMVHFQYRINASDLLLISKNEDSFLLLASPFSYLFILFSVIVLVVAGAVSFPENFSMVKPSLRTRLQLSLIGILVLTMFAVGILQVNNIIRINAKKNADNLKEKAYSVVVEVQHKYGAFGELQDPAHGELNDFLVKLSNVFFTDINVFNENGILTASSRPQIFEEGLLSDRMDAQAYIKMVIEKNSIFMHNETIGSMQFSSAYLPYYGDHNQLLGFVNLPYFAKQGEAKKEVSSFLVTFINVYILLILFGMFIIILISNYITAPLAVLAKKMSQLRLGQVNEKIPWHQKDEIGKLVSEYNRMIDELAGSAERLAKSERESAWREMARQVAHEIKNPLTPMKLSAQHLEKAWNEKAPDWDKRLARFTKTLVEQIDALSVIASDFSDFAKMPEIVFTRVDMEEVIRFVLSLYLDSSPITFLFHSEISEPCILADRSQIIRLLTNLLNNAVQAIDVAADGKVVVSLERENKDIVVRVSDNGCGISADRTDRIFRPDFTTKTSGMGLGLAISKGIVDAMNGTISFTSEEQKGTTFTIKFPADE